MKNAVVSLLSVAAFGSAPLLENARSDAKSATWRGQSVTEFSQEENEAFGWQVVNDGVMGGLSKGKIEMSDTGTMTFTGNLSLENNGGFSLARSERVDFNLSNDQGILLRVKGDGRTYEVRLESDAKFRSWPVSFSGKFETTKDEWQQVKIPFSSFKGGFRGRELPDAKLDPSQIYRVGIIIADKQEGPFAVELDWIRTYGKGKGSYTERTPSTNKVSNKDEGSNKPLRLIATAEADGRFTTLKSALDAAGLTAFFQWDNPLTVFAPTDEAFAKLPKETLKALLKPANKDNLVSILSYHVGPGNNALADILESGSVEVIRNRSLSIKFSQGNVMVNDATIIDADIKCQDGTIHVIDTVLLPPGLKLK